MVLVRSPCQTVDAGHLLKISLGLALCSGLHTLDVWPEVRYPPKDYNSEGPHSLTLA